MKRRTSIIIGFAALVLIATTADPALAATTASPSQGGAVAAAGIGIRLLDIPSDAQTDPRVRAYIVDNLAPGATIQRRVEIENNTDAAQSVDVYASAAHIADDSFVGEDGATPDELTGWISAGQSNVTIPAHQTARNLITIAVPTTATEGERYAAIWAQIRAVSAKPGTGDVVSVSRVGIRVYLSVAPGNGPTPAFTITSLTAHRNADGSPEIVATVKNTGGRAIDLSGTVALSNGPGSLSAGPFAVDRVTTLAPGGDGTVTATLDAGLPHGRWNATLVLTSGLLTQTLGATVTFSAADATQTSTAASALPIGWVIAAIVLIVLLLGAALIVWLTRRRRRLSL